MLLYLYATLFSLLLPAAAPLLLTRMLLRKKYRRSFPARLGIAPYTLRESLSEARPIWVHALSVGEVLSAVPLVNRLRSEFPEVPVFLSTATETGQDMALLRLSSRVSACFFMPLDLGFVVRHTVRRVNPRLFVLVETDLWPNLIHTLSNSGIPAAFVNVRISDGTLAGYRRAKPLIRRVLNEFRILAPQTLSDARRLTTLGADEERITITGNLKFDVEVSELSDLERIELSRSLGFEVSERRVWVAGSTHPGEEELVFQTFRSLSQAFPDLLLVLAPRDRERFDAVHRQAVQEGFSVSRRSESPSPGAEVIILDTFGELSAVYGLADVAFVGGSLVPRGGHNLLEPAVHGVPVLFGPHTEDFRDMASALERKKAGIRVANAEELLKGVEGFLRDGKTAAEYGDRGREFVLANRGAVAQTIDGIRRFL